jgi:hypothetical protein
MTQDQRTYQGPRQARTFGGPTGSAEFDDTGFLEHTGAGQFWVDVDFPIVARNAAVGQPTPTTLVGNITAPNWALNDYSVCEGQELIHPWAVGTALYWHLHMITNGEEGVDKYTRWELEYHYVSFNQQIVSPAIITTADILIPANTPTKTHRLVSLGNFIPDANIGTQVYARLKRVATTDPGGATPAPTANPWVTMLQMHVLCNTLGSRQITSK